MREREQKNLLVFGYGLSAISLFLELKALKAGRPGLAFLLLVGAVGLALLTVSRRRQLKVVYKAWMAVARVIGGLITVVILSLVYFLMFAGVGIALRLLRKDILDQQIDRKRSSYWVAIEQTGFEPEDYKRQY